MEEAKRLNDDLTRYLADEMGSDERASFERRMKSDTRLQNKVAEKRSEPETWNGNATTDSTAAARTRDAQQKPIRPDRFTLLKKIARVAGALLAILIVVFAATRGYRYYQLSPEQLYAEAFLPYELPVSAGDTAEARSSIVGFYRNQKFDSVIRRAKKQVLLSPGETLLTGVSYLVADDPFWAINPLKKLSEGGDGRFAAEADFYLALAYLKNKDYDYALTVIQRIKRAGNHKYNAQFSDEMIKKVEMLKWR